MIKLSQICPKHAQNALIALKNGDVHVMIWFYYSNDLKINHVGNCVSKLIMRYKLMNDQMHSFFCPNSVKSSKYNLDALDFAQKNVFWTLNENIGQIFEGCWYETYSCIIFFITMIITLKNALTVLLKLNPLHGWDIRLYSLSIYDSWGVNCSTGHFRSRMMTYLEYDHNSSLRCPMDSKIYYGLSWHECGLR